VVFSRIFSEHVYMPISFGFLLRQLTRMLTFLPSASYAEYGEYADPMLLLRGSAPEVECHAFLGRQTADGWSPPVEFRERGSLAMDGEADTS